MQTVKILPDRLAEIEQRMLAKGAHSDQKQMCVMEAVAYVAGEPWSDSPACASPVIAAFLRRWNDDLDDETRQKLKPFVAKLVGSKSTEAVESKRAWMLLDWLVRHYTPAWLDLAGLTEQATALRALAEWTPKTWRDGQGAIADAKTRSAAAWDAARAAAGAAAWAAAWDAARAAARAAAWAAAWAAAGDAAWDAAWDAARAAAGAAAWDALKPTVISVQQSALELLDRMLAAE
jgi:hypothetical protein